MIYSMLYLLLLMQMIFIGPAMSQNAVFFEARLSNVETDSYVTSFEQRPGSPVATVKATTPGEYPENSTIWAYFPQDSERTVIFASQFWDTFISVYGDPDIGTRLLWTASPWPWQVEDNQDVDGSRLLFVRSAYDTLFWTSNPWDPRFIGIQPKMNGQFTPHISWKLIPVGEGENKDGAGASGGSPPARSSPGGRPPSAQSPPVRRPPSAQSPPGARPPVVQPPQGNLVRPGR
jgi:hypothetical protein